MRGDPINELLFDANDLFRRLVGGDLSAANQLATVELRLAELARRAEETAKGSAAGSIEVHTPASAREPQSSD